MRRVVRELLYLTVGALALLLAANCSDRSASPPTDAKVATTDVKTDGPHAADAKATDANADAIDCSVVGCAAPPPCGQPCTAPCGCCSNPTCVTDAGPEVGATTPCGPTLKCNSTEEMCVESGPVGPSSTFACKAVPAGCEANRTCACVGTTLCTGAFKTCHDVNTPNTIYCECPGCQ